MSCRCPRSPRATRFDLGPDLVRGPSASRWCFVGLSAALGDPYATRTVRNVPAATRQGSAPRKENKSLIPQVFPKSAPSRTASRHETNIRRFSTSRCSTLQKHRTGGSTESFVAYCCVKSMRLERRSSCGVRSRPFSAMERRPFCNKDNAFSGWPNSSNMRATETKQSTVSGVTVKPRCIACSALVSAVDANQDFKALRTASLSAETPGPCSTKRRMFFLSDRTVAWAFATHTVHTAFQTDSKAVRPVHIVRPK
mmetsp:Transcript_85156/g.237680  ORF Transcript_85156/g.237680 Transcript_85156/m.237680 type:complete len:254 (+) Transcript_85156:156-917(+)